jgi:hypothetical protein
VFVHHDNAHKRIKALEKENAELREANKMLNERCKTCAYYLQTPSIKKVEKAEALLGENAALKARAELLASTNTELGMQVKKAEAEVKDLMHDRAFLIAWLKSEGIKVKVGGKCEREGAGSEITIGSNTPLWEAEAKLATIEKDLREMKKCIDEDCEGITLAAILYQHFPDKKAKEPELCGVCGGVRGCCLCLEGTPKKVKVNGL